MKKVIYGAIIVGGVILLINGFVEKEQQAQVDGRKKVTVSVTESSDYTPENYYGGIVQGLNRSVISAELSGAIGKIFVKEGQLVGRGQLLAIISVSDLSLKIKQAEVGARIVEEQEKGARRRWSNYTPEEKKQFKLQSEKARLGASEVRAMLDKTEIRAPYSWIVSEKFIQSGDTVFPGMKLFEVIDNGNFREVVVDVPNFVGDMIKVGDKVMVQNSVGDKVDASIGEISPKINAQTGKVSVRVILTKEQGFALGDFVRIGFGKKVVKNIVEVPQNAIIKSYEDNFVFIEKDGVVQMKKIEVLGAADRKVAIKGVGSGERVVVSGAHDISDGEEVEVVEIIK